jgi:hypothetical protein
MFTHSPKIVTNGLILCLDAANPKSYPGSGINWSDLSGNGNNGTLTNGPTFDSGNNGSIKFDGVNDYINTNASGTINLNQGTICCWCKYDSIGAPSPFSNKVAVGYGGNETDTGFLLYSQGNRGLEFAAIEMGNPNLGRTASLQYLGKWIYQVGTYSSESVRLYINGMLGASSTPTGPSMTSSSPFWIGGEFNRPSFQFIGNIASVQYYNRALTASEVLQNYNATKGRFGL